MGQSQSSAPETSLYPALEHHTLQFQDGSSWETQRFYDRNMMHIGVGAQATLGTYTSRHTPRGEIVYQYIPIGRDGIYTGRIYHRRGRLLLDLHSELRQVRGAPCYLYH